jgi:hypothetical protein
MPLRGALRHNPRLMRRPRPHPRSSVLAVAAASLALAGCGNERTPTPDTARPLAPQGTALVRYPEAGVRFATPGRWDRAGGQAPLVATVTSGRATIAVWRFPRAEPLPGSAEDLRRARRTLLAAARARDPSFRLHPTHAVTRRRVGGLRALEVRGTGTVEGQERAVRSLHVYGFGGEVVVDALAPPAQFGRVDREVFGPLLRSVRLSAPRGGP